jgi:choline monooxygenase
VPEGQSRCDGRLTCLYHGWRYALDGRLASARDFGPAEGFDPRNYGLFAVACETWRGFVFVNMDAKAEPLAHAIAPLETRARDLSIERFKIAHTASHDLACNWKTYTENFLEGYHVGPVHPALSASLASPYIVEMAPPAQFYSADPHEGAAVAGLWGWVWPSLGFNVYADGILMERMWPIDGERTRLDYLWLFAEDAGENVVTAQIAASDVTTREDIAICEAVQRNLDAGIYDRGRLSPKHEQGIAWFQGEIARRLSQAGIEVAA